MLDTEYTDQAVITAGGKSFHIPVLRVSPSMKWESWFKHTEYFSSQWLLKEKLPFQSYDVFLGKCAGLTTTKLEKNSKGKLRQLHLKLRTAEYSQISWRMKKGTARQLQKTQQKSSCIKKVY